MSDFEYEAIEIVGIAEDDIEKDSSEAIYRIPFKLNKTPHSLWEILLNRRWEENSENTLYCENKRIIVENPDINNLEDIGRESLEPVINKTNQDFKQLIANTKVKTNAIFK